MDYDTKNSVRWLLYIYISLLGLVPLSAQVKGKQPLTVKDYSRWSTVTLRDISVDGQWCSYQIAYENMTDSLFVKNTRTGSTFAFPGTQNGAFGLHSYSALGSDNILRSYNLKTGALVQRPGIGELTYAMNGSRMICRGTNQELSIMDESGKVLFNADSIISFEASPKADRLAYWIRRGKLSVLELVDLKNLTTIAVHSQVHRDMESLIWDELGSQLLSTCNGESPVHQALLFYNCNLDKKYLLEKPVMGPFSQWSLTLGGTHIAAGGKVNLLYRPAAQNIAEDDLAEVWHYADKRLYPARKKYGAIEDYDLLFQWTPSQNTFVQLSDKGMPFMNLSPDGKHLLQWNKFAMEPQTSKEARRNIYCRDIITGVTTMLVDSIQGNELTLLASPKGGYITYFKDGDWYLYSYQDNKAIALGRHIGTVVSKPEDGVHKELVPIDMVYFSEDEKWIWVRDEFDWWAIDTKKLLTKRLTYGRAKGIRYQIATSSFDQQPSRYSGNYARSLNLEKPIAFLKTDMHNFSNGYCLIGADAKETPLFFGPNRLSQIMMSQSGTVVFLKEDFNTPQSIELMERPYKKARSLYRSNPHEKQYEWGSVALKRYKRANGKELGSLVYYPPGFDKNRKYPVIVYIYENLANDLHKYLNPSILESIGFNIPDLLAQGYIVFLPDTESDLGNPGPANVDCVTNAVKMLVAEGYADAENIGLIGHSHGGYKVMYILTQTPIFKAAIAGDGISNIVTDYLTLSLWDGPLYWRYEHDQLRMGVPLYGNMESYIKNSAVYNAQNISTPLLAWSGKEDYHVMKEQTMQMYFALRRMGKEHIMLLYPNEGHSLVDPKNQVDIRNKLSDWFGFYLKGNPKAQWMQPKE